MIYCPQCGSQLAEREGQSTKFCKYCGYKLRPVSAGAASTPEVPEKAIRGTSRPLHTESIYEIPKPAFVSPMPGAPVAGSPPLGADLDEPETYSTAGTSSTETKRSFSNLRSTEEFPAISADLITLLSGRIRSEGIKDDISALLVEIEKIEKKLDIGLISASEAKQEISERQQILLKLKKEKSILSTEDLPWEKYKKDLEKVEEKRRKLQEMRVEGKIARETVYEKLRTEYDTEYERLRELYDLETKRLTQWSRQLDEDVKNFKDHLELLETRSQLGEISQAEANSEKTKMDTDIVARSKASNAIKQLLGIKVA